MTEERVVVVAAVIFDATREHVWAFRRKAGKIHGGLWEFPGGKIEPGETDEHALRRELDEELGVEVTVLERLGVEVAATDRAELEVRFYRCEVPADPATLELVDHDGVARIAAGELDDYDWAPGDVAFVAMLGGMMAPPCSLE